MRHTRAVFGLLNVDGTQHPEERNLYLLRFPLHHDDSIRRESARNNLDPAWVAAEIRAESVFDPKARSSADARGLMQVLPGTGAGVAAMAFVQAAAVAGSSRQSASAAVAGRRVAGCMTSAQILRPFALQAWMKRS